MHFHVHVERDHSLRVDVQLLQVHVAADDDVCDVEIQHVPVLVGMAVGLQAVVAPKNFRPIQDQRDPQCERTYVVEPVAAQNVVSVLASSQVVSDIDHRTASLPVALVDGSCCRPVASAATTSDLEQCSIWSGPEDGTLHPEQIHGESQVDWLRMSQEDVHVHPDPAEMFDLGVYCSHELVILHV